jgi:two-component system chemotaxis response regulator CheB
MFKPAGMNASSLFDALPERIRDAVARGTNAAPGVKAKLDEENFDERKIICLGASTGGVDALVTVLRLFPRNCPPTLIVQHMPHKFIPLFAQRLNTVCPPSVAVATTGAEIRPGRVLVAPAGQHLRLSRRNPGVCMVEDRPAVNGFKPSVDVLFHSAADIMGEATVAALLTGMGRDGADGLLAIRRSGGVTFAQDEATSVVWGMPRVAAEIGAVDRPLPLGKIAGAVLNACRAAAVQKSA